MGNGVGKRAHQSIVHIAAPIEPVDALRFVRIQHKVLRKHVERQRTPTGNHFEGYIPPCRKRFGPGPACIKSAENAVLKREGQKANVVEFLMPDAVADFAYTSFTSSCSIQRIRSVTWTV